MYFRKIRKLKATPRLISCSVTQLCLILFDPMDCSMLGFPVRHHILELVQTPVH